MVFGEFGIGLFLPVADKDVFGQQIVFFFKLVMLLMPEITYLSFK